MQASRPSAVAVILAGGSGTRVGADRNKVFLPVAGRRVISWSVAAFVAAGFQRLVLVARPDDLSEARAVLSAEVDAPIEVVEGGATRHDSEFAALSHLSADIDAGRIDLIAIHDGARPLISAKLIHDVVAAAASHGGAVPGLPVIDLARISDGTMTELDPRTAYWRVQTPQAFRAAPLLSAYRLAHAAAYTGSDTAASMERFGELPVVVVPGEPQNLKITYPVDVAAAAKMLAGRPT